MQWPRRLKGSFVIEEFSICVTGFSALLWCGFALLTWRPWANREVLDAVEGANGDSALDEITVLVPARNEAEVIRQTLRSPGGVASLQASSTR